MIGVRSIVLPGLSIGNQVVIGGVAWLQKVFIRIVLQPEILQKY